MITTVQEPVAGTTGYLGPLNSFAMLICVIIWLYVLFRTAQRTPIKLPDTRVSVADFYKTGLYYAGSKNSYTELKANGKGTKAAVRQEVQQTFLNLTPVDEVMVEIGNKIYTAPELLAEGELSDQYEGCLFGKEETRNQLCAFGIERGSWQKLTDDETYERRSESQISRTVIRDCLIRKAREHFEDKEQSVISSAWSRIGAIVFGNNPDEMILDGETVIFNYFFCV